MFVLKETLTIKLERLQEAKEQDKELKAKAQQAKEQKTKAQQAKEQNKELMGAVGGKAPESDLE